MALAPKPPIEPRAGGDLRANPFVVEVEQCLLTHHQVVATSALQESPQTVQQVSVFADEGRGGVPVPLHEGVADENFPRLFAVKASKVDPPGRHDCQAIKSGTGSNDRCSPGPVPCGLAVGPFQQVGGGRLDPLGLDRGNNARP